MKTNIRYRVCALGSIVTKIHALQVSNVLNSGFEINSKNPGGNTPLMIAVSEKLLVRSSTNSSTP